LAKIAENCDHNIDPCIFFCLLQRGRKKKSETVGLKPLPESPVEPSPKSGRVTRGAKRHVEAEAKASVEAEAKASVEAESKASIEAKALAALRTSLGAILATNEKQYWVTVFSGFLRVFLLQLWSVL
jgi:hypothetical protein